MISSVAPTRLSTFYAYLIAKIGNRNLNVRMSVIMAEVTSGQIFKTLQNITEIS